MHMVGFKGSGMNLSVGDAALAARIHENMRLALAEDRMIRMGVMPETISRDQVINQKMK